MKTANRTSTSTSTKGKGKGKLDIKSMAIAYTRAQESASDTLVGHFRMMTSVDQAIEYFDAWSVEYDVINSEKYQAAGKAKAPHKETLKILADDHASKKPKVRTVMLYNINKAKGIAIIPAGHSFGHTKNKGFTLNETQVRDNAKKSDVAASNDALNAASANEAKFAALASKHAQAESELALYKAWAQMYVELAKKHGLPLISRDDVVASIAPKAKAKAKKAA
jgi:hypothetical protein